MEVILREDIPKLGNKGDVVKVRAGYARNYLLPRKLAILSTAGTRKQIDDMRAAAERKAAREKGSAEALASQLALLEVAFQKRAGDQGQLFGSVTASDIAASVAEKGFTIDRRRIELSEPIKQLGDYTVEVRLHRDVSATLRVKVLSETGEEAPPPPAVAAPVEESVTVDGSEGTAPSDDEATGKKTAEQGGDENPSEPTA